MNSNALSSKARSLGMHLVSTNQGWTVCKGMNLLSGKHFKTLEEVRTYFYGPADAPIMLPADLYAGYLGTPHLALETPVYVPDLQRWQEERRIERLGRSLTQQQKMDIWRAGGVMEGAPTSLSVFDD